MQAFSALADPTRRRIVELLAERQQTAGELARRFSITQPAVSQHLRMLRDSGLVTVRPDAQRRIYALDARGFAAIDAWLSRYRAFWSGHLDKLENALRTGDS
jgi:DNA-binding transcriptional ArsR family regulator